MNKSVVITGSARGFGFEMAKQFRQYGFDVMLSDINETGLKNAKQELLKIDSTAKIETCLCDVSLYEQLENLLNTTVKKFGQIDVWINNAGINQPDKAVVDLTQKEIDLIFDIDLKGAVYGSQICFAHMQKQGFGQIYNIEGYGSNDAMMKGLTIYGTSKRGITYFTQALAKESDALNANVKVGRLSPGIMITDFLKNANGDKTKIELPEKTKKVYNILGDYPDVIAKYLVKKVVENKKNNPKFVWLTGRKAFWRFMTAGFSKRNFFEK